MLRPQGESVVASIVTMGILVLLLSLEAGVKYFLIPQLIGVENGMDLSTPVLMIHCEVLLVQALPNVASVNISFTAGVSSICGVILITEILGFVGGGKTETSSMVRQLNNF